MDFNTTKHRDLGMGERIRRDCARAVVAKVAKCVLVAALFCAIAALFAGCADAGYADTSHPDLPPCPLEVDTYRRETSTFTYTDMRVYDCTTGHTWWLLDTGHSSPRYVVLDTAGTEDVG